LFNLVSREQTRVVEQDFKRWAHYDGPRLGVEQQWHAVRQSRYAASGPPQQEQYQRLAHPAGGASSHRQAIEECGFLK
jgi:hypothetical protein